MIHVVLSQPRWQEAAQEGRLPASLRPDEHGHALVAVQGVHLQPVGNSRAQPYGEERRLLRAHAWQPAEQLGHMVMAVPLGKTLQKLLHGVEQRHFLRAHVQLDVCLWGVSLAYILAHSTQDDAVQRLLRKRAEGERSLVRDVVLRIVLYGGEFQLAVEHVAAETIVFIQERLNAECSHHVGTKCLATNSGNFIFLTHC